jgi:hypothetical protein
MKQPAAINHQPPAKSGGSGVLAAGVVTPRGRGHIRDHVAAWLPDSDGPYSRAVGAGGGRGTDGRVPPMIKYVYEIDYPPGGKDKYLAWVRSIAATLQAPGELRRLASYDNVYSLTPHRVVEFTFDSPEDAARYFGREEIGLILQTELPAHSANIHIKVLTLRHDYSKDTTGGTPPGQRDQS